MTFWCACPAYTSGLVRNKGLVQFRVTRLDVGLVLVLVLVIGFSALSITITSTASLSTSTKTGQADCYPYAHFCEPGRQQGVKGSNTCLFRPRRQGEDPEPLPKRHPKGPRTACRLWSAERALETAGPRAGPSQALIESRDQSAQGVDSPLTVFEPLICFPILNLSGFLLVGSFPILLFRVLLPSFSFPATLCYYRGVTK